MKTVRIQSGSQCGVQCLQKKILTFIFLRTVLNRYCDCAAVFDHNEGIFLSTTVSKEDSHQFYLVPACCYSKNF